MPDTERLRAEAPQDLSRAAHLLRSGHTVAFPTETVYGLGANALDPTAVQHIFSAKQRPRWDPLIVHIADPGQLPQIASFPLDPAAARTAMQLLNTFWPGPLTLLLPRTEAIPDAVTAGRALVGVRMPSHPVARALLREAAVPIAAPSANRFGHTSPTSAAHVLADLDGRIDAVLDGGSTQVGLESTVVEVAPGGGLIVYRPGGVTCALLATVVQANQIRAYHHEPADRDTPESLPSPGVGIRHYAPAARVLLVHVDPADPVHSFLFKALHHDVHGRTVGVMLPDGWRTRPEHAVFPWGDWARPADLAHNLFEGLRTLDERHLDLILCPVPEGPGLAEAIRDRLHKAAK